MRSEFREHLEMHVRRQPEIVTSEDERLSANAIMIASAVLFVGSAIVVMLDGLREDLRVRAR